jgi:ribosomal protein S12 methylthiotransferase accessory factor
VCSAAISPPEFVLYSEEQYKTAGRHYQRWSEEGEVAWINGTELPTGRTVAVPASLAYLVHPAPRPEDFFTPASSNGLAAGPTLPRAILGALCELMERDSFLIAWMNRLPAVELDLSESGELPKTLLRHYARFSVEIRAFMLPTDLPASTIMAMSIDPRPDRPAHIVGLGCHPNPHVALRKALFELCQGRPAEAKRFSDKPPRDRLKHYQDVKTLDDHSAFHSLPEQLKEFAFLWDNSERACIEDFDNPSNDDVERDLARCVQTLTHNGHRVAYVDLTLPDVAACGIHVVRAIATGLQPIHFGHGQERLGGRRLFELPVRLGYAKSPTKAEELNPCPHPLA